MDNIFIILEINMMVYEIIIKSMDKAFIILLKKKANIKVNLKII